jgi:hypothetical protein
MDTIVIGLCSLLVAGSIWLQGRQLRGTFRHRESELWRTVIVVPWSCCAFLIGASILLAIVFGVVDERYDLDDGIEFVLACALIFSLLAAKASLSILTIGANSAAWLFTWYFDYKIVGSPVSGFVQNLVEGVLPELLLWFTTIIGFVWALFNLKATTFEAALRELWFS